MNLSLIKKASILALLILPITPLIDQNNRQKFQAYLQTFLPQKPTNKTEIQPTKPSPPPKEYRNFDIVVYGDELPGICAAIWAKKTLGNNAKIALIRPNSTDAQLGGLLTRGGLGYLDFDKTPGWYRQPHSQCFIDFLNKAQIIEACVEPENAHKALQQMLAEAGVTLISESRLIPAVEAGKIEYVEVKNSNLRIKATAYIDTTQDAELARKAGLKYYLGYESQNPKLRNETLAVSIVPIVEGLSISDLRNVEADILYDYEKMAEIEESIRKYQPPDGARFWLNNFWQPLFQRYQDGFYQKSIALGAAYHLEKSQPFKLEGFFFDKANICVKTTGKLSWNGFLFKYSVEEVRELEENGLKPNQEMIEEMAEVEEWLRRLSGKDVRIKLPPEVYVRHSLSIKDVVDPLTGQEILRGGTLAANSMGTFSYEFDFRGGIKGIGIKMPPLPIYNFGIESALARDVENLAIVGRSSGYGGIAVSVGRILTVNIYQGQGVGVAAGLAVRSGRPLNGITSREVRETLESLTGLTTYLQGEDTTLGVDYSEIK
ncbi:MAG: FAD-dependent oxidoreductase [Okeania sp. SIO2H7]|nr:FAD-dependent oxidoreductase [Okeania sp. SIO2H7]